ncbi:RNA polymerase factor sigma-54 [Luteimonas sp. RD2P54]|uniref:RNA polymerase sigma-54 factor n=1 Tax=Luteimonas endophytica TaxID=3042023 RepID=A0ABT6JB61_9GAMM|nr:RNA polymerase factor sigma-54 [Luteimonas endophytica]MDH5823999.1 RNA polymerase factor sigma-54 [Luteimonas endophytica]
MKPRLQTSLGQHLVLTPQLRQALHLLQLSALELEAEIASAVESNPLLDWQEHAPLQAPSQDGAPAGDEPRVSEPEPSERWEMDDSWYGGAGAGSGPGSDDDGDPTDRLVQTESLREHLAWQLHLSHLSARDRGIGDALIDAIDDDGYLRTSFADIADTLQPEIHCEAEEILAVLRQIQRLDPAGVGARDLRECLRLQLDALPGGTPGRALAGRIVDELIEDLPRIGPQGLAEALHCEPCEAETALQLLRSLDPRPGAQIGGVSSDTYVAPDCAIERHQGVWKVALVGGPHSRLTIHRGYEGMIRHASEADAGYLRGRLQEARWLLKNVQARGETLLKVVRCLVRQQSGFLEFGPQALRPLTLREVAAEIGMHESTVSRAIARKYVHTPRGTLPLRQFFASGVGTDSGGQASSTAIQQMIRGLVDAENPRKPLSDARLAEALKAAGVAVARRTVTKYREAMNIPSSHDRVRLG